jgi:NADH-quinone oxidoreductase subunit H
MATITREKRRGPLNELVHGYTQVRDNVVPQRLWPWANLLTIGAALTLGAVATYLLILLIWAFIEPRQVAIGGAIESIVGFIFNHNRVDPTQVIDCRTSSGCSTIQAIVYSLVFFVVVLTGFAYMTFWERRLIAFFQQRVGPNRVGPAGLLQPAADGVKLIFKEDIEPAGADKWVYRIAPVLKVVPALILLAVVPLGPNLTIPWFDGNTYSVPLGLADPNVGVLWLLAITSIGTYGVVLAGWASNNKYAMLGGLRASAQMLSYELSLGLTMAVPVMLVASMSISDIVRAQTYFYEWFVFQNPLAFGILFIALMAELNRSPFDLPEAEQELTQGFMTEYSGMKFASFMMAEYLSMIGVSAVIASLYLGGYNDGFGIVASVPILGPVVLIGKIFLLLSFMVWVRATLPRIRYDRLMALGWKVLLPLAMVAVGWTAVAILIADALGSVVPYAIFSGIVFVIVIGAGYLMLRRRGEADVPTDVPEDLANDPVVTGERHGVGFALIQIVGALIAIPIGLYTGLIRILDNLSQLAPQKPAPPSDETAVVLSEKSGE